MHNIFNSVKADPKNTGVRLALGAWVIFFVTACGGSGRAGDTDSDPQDAVLLDSSVNASGNPSIAADPGTPEFTPSPGNGLPILYQDAALGVSMSDEYIGGQWEYMQTCLMVSAQEPVVFVIDNTLEPTDSNDDVVRHIDGQIQASSHVTDTSATIQIRAQDFDGTLGSPGAYLRSIMGRYLWLANGLAERDYPYDCARVE